LPQKGNEMTRFSTSIAGFTLLLWAASFGAALALGPSPTPTLSALDVQKEQLELEKMKLENERLKLEVEKLRLQATPNMAPSPQATPTPEKKQLSDEDKKKEADSFQREVSKQAGDLSKAHKGEENILVLDFVNGEAWHNGIPYTLHEIYAMANEEKMPMDKKVDGRLNNGVPRNLFAIHNATLLRYESRDRGIFEITRPGKESDFKILTPEGISFDSTIGDLRNAYQSVYFAYDGQGERNGLKTLRYQHSRGLNFADKLEFLLDKDGKVKSIRYGVLDEH